MHVAERAAGRTADDQRHRPSPEGPDVARTWVVSWLRAVSLAFPGQRPSGWC